MYKIVNGLAPHHLINNIIFTTDVNERQTRNTEANNLYIPRANLNMFKESLQYNGAVLWNKLYPELRNSETLLNFKKEYKVHYWS